MTYNPENYQLSELEERRRIDQRAMAGLTAIAMLASTALGVAHAQEEASAGLAGQGVPSASQTLEDLSQAVYTEPVPPQVWQDFAAAEQADICTTRASAQSAAAIYQRIALTREHNWLSEGDLAALADQEIERLQAMRQQQGFAPLPPDFSGLENGMVSGNVSIGEYKQAARDYFEQRGITAVFDWQTADPTAPNYAPDLAAGELGTWQVTPIHDSEAHATNLSRAVLDTMRSLSMLQPDLVPQVGGARQPRTIYIGRLADTADPGREAGDIEALAAPDGRYLVIDGGDPVGDLENLSAPAHEISHGLYFVLCNDLEDQALMALSRGAPYDDDSSTRLVNGELLNGTITDFQHVSNGGVVVFGEAHGARNSYEDGATSFGRYALYPSEAVQLYTNRVANTSPLLEKIAWYIDRVAQRSPAAAQVIEQTMRVARLRAAINQRVPTAGLKPTIDKLDRALSSYQR